MAFRGLSRNLVRQRPLARLFLDGKDVDGFDDELDGVANFEVEVLMGFGSEDGGHLGGGGHVEFYERHDLVAFDGGDFGSDFVASSVFHVADVNHG